MYFFVVVYVVNKGHLSMRSIICMCCQLVCTRNREKLKEMDLKAAGTVSLRVNSLLFDHCHEVNVFCLEGCVLFHIAVGQC